jgi:O-antigen/teichoic acid export membrane protein
MVDPPDAAASVDLASPSDVTSGRLLRNTLVNGVANASSAIVTAVLTPFLLHRLGASEYGIWVLALSLTFSSGYLALADLGLGEAAVKFIAEARAAGATNVVNEIASTTVAVFAGIGLVVGGAIASAAPLVVRVFDVDGPLSSAAQVAFLLMGLEVVLELPASALRAVVEGAQRYLPLRSMDVAGRALWGVLVVIAVNRGHGVVSLAVLTLLISALRLAASAVTAHRIQPGLRLRPRSVTRAALRRTIGYGGFVGGLKLLTVIYAQMDRVIIGVVVSVAAVARYEVAFRVQSLAVLVLTMSSSAVLPATAYNAARGDVDKQRELYLRGSKYAVALCLSVTVAALLHTRPLITAWVGAEYTGVTTATRLFLIFPLVSCINQVGVAMLIGLGYAPRVLVLQAIGVGTNLVISVTLAPSLGISGVVIGTTVGGLVVWGPYVRLLLRTFDVSRAEWWRRLIAPNLPGLVAQTLVGLVVVALTGDAHRLWQVGALMAFSCLVHLSVFSWLGMADDERRHLVAHLGAG